MGLGLPKSCEGNHFCYLENRECSRKGLCTGRHFLGIEPLRDPEGIFAALDEGDRGLAIWQAGQYWAIQAACPKGDK